MCSHFRTITIDPVSSIPLLTLLRLAIMDTFIVSGSSVFLLTLLRLAIISLVIGLSMLSKLWSLPISFPRSKNNYLYFWISITVFGLFAFAFLALRIELVFPVTVKELGSIGKKLPTWAGALLAGRVVLGYHVHGA